jgi:hypothetical protein
MQKRAFCPAATNRNCAHEHLTLAGTRKTVKYLQFCLFVFKSSIRRCLRLVDLVRRILGQTGDSSSQPQWCNVQVPILWLWSSPPLSLCLHEMATAGCILLAGSVAPFSPKCTADASGRAQKRMGGTTRDRGPFCNRFSPIAENGILSNFRPDFEFLARF